MTGCSLIRPNVLICVSDDQSYPHASAYGCKFVNTPNFDRIAREGVLYTNAFCSSPGCSPSRASLLTGLHPWQLKQAGTHASSFPFDYETYPYYFERSTGRSDRQVGFSGKGWGPGHWQIDRAHDPTGWEYNEIEAEPQHKGIRRTDYAANFEAFLEKRTGSGFYFWFGASEPHRDFEKGVGLAAGKRLDDVEVPAFLPDTDEVRSDLLDYATEIEHFDMHLGRMLDILESRDELDNTLIIVTSDNGMAFPRAKANCYEYGVHVPLAIRGPRGGIRSPRGFDGGRVVNDLVSFVDLTATIYDVADSPWQAKNLPGRSLALAETRREAAIAKPASDVVYFGRERHSSSRHDNLGYPQRAIRTKDYLYIRNFKPDRWPAGDPQKFEEDGSLGPMHGGYHDIDACPTLDYLIENRNDPAIRPYFLMSVDKRPADELYDIRNDPGCLHNLAGDIVHASARLGLAQRLLAYLRETGDPRVLGNGDIWETYERYSPIRTFPEPPEAL
jgi:N-sulfoglucosamine sulfohydrolase